MAAEITTSPFGDSWLVSHAERSVVSTEMDGTSARVTLGSLTDEVVATKFRYLKTTGETVEMTGGAAGNSFTYTIPTMRNGERITFTYDAIIDPSDVYRITEQLKAAWQLGQNGIPYIIEMLEEHCVKVIEIDAPNTFDGLSGVVGEHKPIIVLNKNFPIERKRFTAMHELGHLLLDFDETLSQKDVERFCNLFANEMLISQDVFKKNLGISRHDISLNELRAIQSNYGISVEAQMFKAKQLGIISESRYKYFCISKNQNPAFREQVEKSTFHEEKSTRFASLVYRALASELITFSKASDLLNESIYVVREQLELV